MGKGWDLQGIFRVWGVLRDLGQMKTHLENNSCRPFLENGACGAYRLCTHFVLKLFFSLHCLWAFQMNHGLMALAR